MKKIHQKFFLTISTAAVMVGILAFSSKLPSRSALAQIFADKNITVEAATPTSQAPAWTITQKITEAAQLLKGAKPGVFGDPITYNEQRFSFSGGVITNHNVQIKEPEKEIALAVLDTQTGQIKTFFIRKSGEDLLTPPGWQINILERPSGITWNGWNTSYKIIQPENYVVIGNVYPDETDTTVRQKKNGRTVYITQRTVAYRYYVPYSPDLNSYDLAGLGQSYIKNVVAQAFADLRTEGVGSQAVSGSSVADVFGSHTDFFERIPLLEQTDLTEFEINPSDTVKRAEIIIGANGTAAFNATCNSVAACGWLQFTPGTYAMIVKAYPTAHLIPDFKAGAADHLNSMKAAILLYDTNLKSLLTTDPNVLNDQNLEEYLASSYNGSPNHAKATLKAAIISGIEDWINALTSKNGGLKNETVGYLTKLRWLKQNNIPAVAVN